MPHDRFYFPAPLITGETISLKEAELHHLQVQKVRVGDEVEVVNGRRQLGLATVRSLDKAQALLHIHAITTDSSVQRTIILAQAIPKMNHLEWIIEKGVELGVTSFWLFPGMYSEKTDFSENQRTRLNHLILSAMKQCGRLDLTTIEFKPRLLDWSPQKGTLLYGDLEAPYLWTINPTLQDPIILFIGPERGLHSQEITFLNGSMGAKGVKFHPNTLRTETASLVGLSLIQAFL